MRGGGLDGAGDLDGSMRGAVAVLGAVLTWGARGYGVLVIPSVT